MTGSRARGGGGDWTVAVEGFCCTVRPPGRGLPEQGWKPHGGAASSVAVEVLSAVAAVIAEDPCAFTFTADREKLHEINSRNSDRGSAGKFLTVHPGDDEQFRRLAGELHLATAGMPGPVILSGRSVLGNDGAYRPVLRAPGGALVEDVRTAVRPGWPTPSRGRDRPPAANRPRPAAARSPSSSASATAGPGCGVPDQRAPSGARGTASRCC
ncbi:hypothetical protein ACFQ2M_12815 [Kitasatospora saccharophila]|uniref:class III lanthionine synthetase LanKC N-terminal domain-containing protein n=1 Tax=Kitasatospora saccharophila TaxID=407973 RepID=UPI0031DBFEC7